MAHAQFFLVNQFLHTARQIKESECVTDACSRSTNSICYLLMAHLILHYQALKCVCFFKRVKVLSLNVFNKCDSNGCRICNGSHNGWDALQSSYLRGSPPSLACNDLVFDSSMRISKRSLSDNNRLDYALCFNGLSELFKLRLFNLFSRLKWSWANLFYTDLRQALFVAFCFVFYRLSQQSI